MPRAATPPERLDEVIDYIERNVRVSREDICRDFFLSDDEYQKMHRSLKRVNGFETIGGGGGGGFSLRSGSTLANDDDVEKTITYLLSDPAKRKAALRLCELFQKAEVEKILTDGLSKALRSYKRIKHDDSRPTKAEAAAGIVIEHGYELFREKNIRKIIARKVGISSPERWMAGHHSACRFAEAAGFPDQFSGTRIGDTPPILVSLNGKKKFPALKPFQEKAMNQLLNRALMRGERGILELPTGSGKTRVAVDMMLRFSSVLYKDHETRKFFIVWTAHQEELCEQAAQTVEDAWRNADEACPINLIRYFGNTPTESALQRISDDEDTGAPSIIIATPIKAQQLLSEQLADHEFVQRVARGTRLVVIDEAHRAAAPTYRAILEVLQRSASIIGLTATPYGKTYLSDSSTKDLLDIFDNNIIRSESLFDDFASTGQTSRQFLMDRRILARPIVREVKTRAKIGNHIDDEQIDNIDETTASVVDGSITRELADRRDRTQHIYRAVRPILSRNDISALYFAPTVQDAFVMTFLLRVDGIAAECVHAGTPASLRRAHIENFKAGRINVLCNVEILTTGFDAPRVTHIIVARPTVSRVLYEQIVGRGLRGPEFGGTENCVIVDCVDNVRTAKLKFGYEYFREAWDIDGVEEYSSDEII